MLRQQATRLLKRLAVLLPGLVIAYLSVRDVFPYFDRRLPLGLAILLTYIVGAYLLAPALIRLVRILRPAKHLPHYSVTPDGFGSDPLNIGIIASRRQLIAAMEAAGWFQADPYRLRYMARSAFSIATGHRYPNAPMSRLYLFGRKQDIAFETSTEGSISHRHHVRFWATSFDHRRRLQANAIVWDDEAVPSLVKGDVLWLGAASQDNGFAFIRHNLQLTHMVDPDTNSERELILSGLQAQGLVKQTQTIRLTRPYRLTNRGWRAHLHSDGRLTVVSL